MVGRTGLAVAKALLTRHCRKLKALAEECEAAKESLCNEEGDDIQGKAIELEEMTKLTATSLSKFAEAVDSMSEVTEEQDQEIQGYLEKAQEAIDHAETVTIQLESLKKSRERKNAGPSHRFAPSMSMGNVEITRPTLPAIPVPMFAGELWEFENFWRLFDANVHMQPLSKLQKFNYLINSLQGDARELIRRFIVTEENYDEAVAMLHRKYGDKTRLINQLQHRLEQVRADDTRTESQRRLLESIIPLVSQLEAHGVYLNGSYTSQKLLSKFSVEIQRKVLQHHLTPGMLEEEWQMKDTIAALDECLSMEERINEMIAFNSREKAVFSMGKTGMLPTREDESTTACMFCNSTDHRTATCTKVRSVSERRRFFQDSERCLNCGRIGHFVKDCRSAGCRVCSGRKHHHALCPKRSDIREGAIPTQTRTRTSANNPQAIPQRQMKERLSKNTKHKDTNQTHIAKTNESRDVKLADQNDCESTAHSEESTNKQKADRVLLLTGTAKVWNNCEGKWMETKILFDTGADQSFIDSNLAQRIGVKCTQKQQLQMYTFGSAEPKCAEYGLAHVKVSDSEGKQHKLHLFITPVVTGKGSKTSLCSQDQAYFEENGITLSRTSQTGDFNPEILLGCDQLWTFLEGLSPHYKLPSGLLLIPSKFGYLLTGKQQRPKDGRKGHWECLTHQWQWSRESRTLKQSLRMIEDGTRNWAMDSAGICEFTGTKDAVMDKQDVARHKDRRNTLKLQDRRDAPESQAKRDSPKVQEKSNTYKALDRRNSPEQRDRSDVSRSHDRSSAPESKNRRYAPTVQEESSRRDSPKLQERRDALKPQDRRDASKPQDRKDARATDNRRSRERPREVSVQTSPGKSRRRERDDRMCFRSRSPIPIEFYQKNLEVTSPPRGKRKTTDDTTYLPPEETRALRTRREAEEAILLSCRITEQFWKVWQQHSLREKLLKNISRNRLEQQTSTGSVVLISHPILPRNSWKLARMTDVRRGSDGVIREADMVTNNRRKVRRPVSLLIPLEINDDISEKTDEDSTSSLNEKLEEERLEIPYDLRPRQKSCNVVNVVTTTRKHNLRNSRRWFLFYIMVLTFATLV